MGDLLTIGGSAVRSYGQALSVTGDNIANAESAGYVRRTVNLVEAPAGTNQIMYSPVAGGNGVTVDGVTRKLDEWLVADVRTALSDVQNAETLSKWLGALETDLADDENGIGDSIGAIFDAGDRLAADPTNTTLRSQWMFAVEQTVERIQFVANKAQAVSDDIATEASSVVDQVNTHLEALARLNNSLERVRDGSAAEANLLDERDRHLLALSQYVAIDADISTNGSVTVRTAAPSSTLLVSGDSAATMAVSAAADGQLSFTIDDGSGPSAFAPSGGTTAGLLAAARVVATRRTELDDLATEVATLVNDFQAAGVDENGTAGTALVDASGGAAAIAMISTDPELVAASDGVTANGNVLSFSSKRTSNDATAAASALSNAHAQATAAARKQEELMTSMYESAAIRRDSISAVDINFEATELMRYQQAYQGAARILQVAREIMQTIFNSL